MTSPRLLSDAVRRLARREGGSAPEVPAARRSPLIFAARLPRGAGTGLSSSEAESSSTTSSSSSSSSEEEEEEDGVGRTSPVMHEALQSDVMPGALAADAAHTPTHTGGDVSSPPSARAEDDDDDDGDDAPSDSTMTTSSEEYEEGEGEEEYAYASSSSSSEDDASSDEAEGEAEGMSDFSSFDAMLDLLYATGATADQEMRSRFVQRLRDILHERGDLSSLSILRQEVLLQPTPSVEPSQAAAAAVQGGGARAVMGSGVWTTAHVPHVAAAAAIHEVAAAGNERRYMLVPPHAPPVRCALEHAIEELGAMACWPPLKSDEPRVGSALALNRAAVAAPSAEDAFAERQVLDALNYVRYLAWV